MSVAARSPEQPSFPLEAFVRASSLHVGAAAAAAALRRDLVDEGRLSASAFDEAYAVARVTPGTNLLAMYMLLGERFAGWRGALTALTVGTLVPTLIAGGIGSRVRRVCRAPACSQSHAGRTCRRHRSIRLGDHQARSTTACSTSATRNRVSDRHRDHDARPASPAVRDSSDRGWD